MKDKFPSAQDIITSILDKYKSLEINQLHQKAYEEIIRLKEILYKNKVNKFLGKLDLPESMKRMLKEKMLEPVEINGKSYANFFEEMVRRITQAVQPISGNIAEICATIELQKNKLKEGIHFQRKVKRTDLVIYYPNVNSQKKIHRVEVKNVSLRERATRGLLFDGDSLLGFFNNPDEFTKENIKIIDGLCLKSSGYCYIPPQTLINIKFPTTRFKSNCEFGKDMLYFVKNGRLP